MKLKYYDTFEVENLIQEFYTLSFSEKVVPFTSEIIPFGFNGLTYIYSKGQTARINKEEKVLKNLIFSGMFYKSYQFSVNEAGFSCGINFTPTTFYKLTGLDLSKFTNKQTALKEVSVKLNSSLSNIFETNKENPEKLFEQISTKLLSIPLIKDKDTKIIDRLITIIHKKEGMLSVKELAKNVNFGKKTLETKFKKIIGLTPGKYIRLHRFLNLMKKYEKDQIDLRDLIFMYNYYDESHFAKDFKCFTSKSFKEYFKKDFLLIKEALKK